MTRPVLQTRPGICYICRKRGITQVHHIFYGPLRGMSDENGLIAHLCMDCHMNAPHAVHRCIDTDLKLRQRCQRAFERSHTRDEFVSLVGKNYLTEKEKKK